MGAGGGDIKESYYKPVPINAQDILRFVTLQRQRFLTVLPAQSLIFEAQAGPL